MQQNELGLEKTEDTNTPGRAAYLRHLQDTGLQANELREFIANARERELFIYSIQVRWPSPKFDSFSVIVKALHPEGPLVGFNNGYQLLGALFGVGQRLRAGNMEWKPDEWPQEDWVERLAFMHSRELNRK